MATRVSSTEKRFWTLATRVSSTEKPKKLGLRLPLVGTVFIPLDEIDALDLEHGSDCPHLRASTSTLVHHSPEIRGPIIVPDWIAEIIAAHYPENVLRETDVAADF